MRNRYKPSEEQLGRLFVHLSRLHNFMKKRRLKPWPEVMLYGDGTMFVNAPAVGLAQPAGNVEDAISFLRSTLYHLSKYVPDEAIEEGNDVG